MNVFFCWILLDQYNNYSSKINYYSSGEFKIQLDGPTWKFTKIKSYSAYCRFLIRNVGILELNTMSTDCCTEITEIAINHKPVDDMI